ncbi:hypothetical protein QBC44DRAFT_41032 [Cladorrhinum sp. PSN332]|nr:hypothetical protein QBC44DRAFT_41032 [Cladorrhinum sp. PSN332]
MAEMEFFFYIFLYFFLVAFYRASRSTPSSSLLCDPTMMDTTTRPYRHGIVMRCLVPAASCGFLFLSFVLLSNIATLHYAVDRSWSLGLRFDGGSEYVGLQEEIDQSGPRTRLLTYESLVCVSPFMMINGYYYPAPGFPYGV